MKYIFDFDDVLFNNTKQFKEHMYASLEKAGVPRNVAETYYKEVREKEFSLRNFICYLLLHLDINKSADDIYKEIMSQTKNFTNTELVELVKKIGKENCYVITNGEYEFNHDKVYDSGLAPLFQEIHIVPGSKSEIIYDICARNSGEEIIFVDDKLKFIEDIDLARCPNLKTILFDETGLEKIKSFQNLG